MGEITQASRIKTIDFTVVEKNPLYTTIALAAITLLAAALRFYQLGAWGFWIDEIYTINRALGGASSDAFTNPLSFRLIGLALVSLGTDEFNARLVPAVIGVISIPAFYFPIRRLFGTTTALLAVLLLAVSPWHLYWSQNARFYTALVLFYGLAELFFFFWMESDNLWYLLPTGLFFGLAILERRVSLYFVPVVAVYFLALLVLPFGKPPGLRWRNIIIMVLPALAFAGYELVSAGYVASFFTKIVGHQHNPLRVLLSVIYDLGLPLFLMALLGGSYLFSQRSRAGLFLLAGALVPLLLLVVMAPFTQTFSRYIFHTLPNWIILAAVGVKELVAHTQKPARLLALGVALVLVADAISQDVLYYTFQNGNREDFKSAFSVVREEKQAGDLVVAGRPEVGAYYLGEAVLSPQEITINGITQAKQRVWFVLDNRSGIPPFLQRWVEDNAQLVSVHDVSIPGKIMTMRVYLYQPSGP